MCEKVEKEKLQDLRIIYSHKSSEIKNINSKVFAFNLFDVVKENF